MKTLRFIPTVFFFSSLVLLTSPSLSTETLVSPGATWKYNDTGTDLGTAWRGTSYDDSGWAAGPAQLGYGDGDEATTISYGSSANNRYPCYYFRHSFSASSPTGYESLTLRVLRDDGCVVYLNGTEVARSNMPSGEIAYSTWASTAIGGTDENVWHEFSVAPGLVGTGPNIIAVEVHQSGKASTDVSFDLELSGNPPPLPAPTVTLVSPPDESVTNNTTVSFTCSATDQTGLSTATLYVGKQPQTVSFSGPSDTDDAQISADTPNTNYGSATTINVDGLTPHAHAVIKFPSVFGSSPGQVPPGSSIAKAVLEVNCLDSGNKMRLYRLIEDWVEAEVTWNDRAAGLPWTNAGADGSGSHAPLVLDGDCSSISWRTFDITAFVQDWSSGSPNYGIVLTDTGTDGVDFYTSESSTPPVLKVTYQTEWQPVEETKPLSGFSDTATFTTTLTDQQDYVWNCLVTNTSGGQSWAPADFRLKVDTGYPNEPVPVAPADGATGVSTSPTLQVSVSDPQGDLLDVTFYGRAGSGVSDFTVVALPDTQKYLLGYSEIFTEQTQWIVNNASSRNIVFVTHEGDIVDTYNDTLQWECASASMSLLDDVVPYGLAPGNHDQPTTYFNQYFPYTRYESKSWYGGHRETTNDTNYEFFSAGGEDFLVLHLEYWPSNDVITWADSVLKGHADRKAIVTTHGFLGVDGSHYVHGMGSTEYIWNGLVVPNPNVYFVLCGHEAGERTRTDVVNGREVHQLLADYQGRPNGGDGWLRTMRFVPSEDRVYVETYSPHLNQYETDADSQFALNFPMGGFSVIGADTNVSSGLDASVVWSDLALSTRYEWYVTVSDSTGKTRTGQVWHFATMSDDATPPTISDVSAVDVTDSSARIIWTTDEPADSLVEYGLDTSYSSSASDAALVTAHSIALTELTPETTYHYKVTSKDADNNAASSGDYTFISLLLNHPPVANNQEVTTDEDTLLLITLTASDADNDSLTYSIVTNPANGTLGGTPPNVTYTPNPDYNGADSFTFKANDGKADSNVATVSITIAQVNDAPAAPKNLSATAGVGKVTLDWDDNVEPEGDLQGYNVYCSTTPGVGYVKINGAVVTVSNYVDSTVANGTTYYYVVTAVDTAPLESVYSNEASAAPYAEQSVHVQDIAMNVQKLGKTSYKASATVLIVDQNSARRSGAKVVGNWRFNGSLIKTGASGTTDSNGNAVINSPLKTAKSGDIFKFEVTNVSLSGYVYASGQNVETSDSISVP